MARYSIINLIGSGTYGTVYLAADTTDRKQYALKYIDLNDKSDIDSYMRELVMVKLACKVLLTDNTSSVACLVESDIVFSIDSRNDIYGLVQYESPIIPHAVLVYTLGVQTIDQLINRKRDVSFSQAAEIIVQIGSALRVLHAHDFAHNDVKLNNIVLSNTGGAKLIDFGLSCTKPYSKTSFDASLILDASIDAQRTKLESQSQQVRQELSSDRNTQLSTELHRINDSIAQVHDNDVIECIEFDPTNGRLPASVHDSFPSGKYQEFYRAVANDIYGLGGILLQMLLNTVWAANATKPSDELSKIRDAVSQILPGELDSSGLDALFTHIQRIRGIVKNKGNLIFARTYTGSLGPLIDVLTHRKRKRTTDTEFYNKLIGRVGNNARAQLIIDVLSMH